MKAKKILIVDDEEDILDLVSDAFDAIEGYSSTHARDGLEALAAAREHNPDLMILDIQLPKLDGYQVCKLLKLDAVLSRIKVLMISGIVQNWDKTEALLVGADGYLAKPFSLEALVAKTEELIGSEGA